MNSRTRPRVRRFAALFCISVLTLAGGCAQPDHSGSELAAGPSTPAAESPISLRAADADEYQQTLDKLRGKVVLVDFWATWCAPCVKQFPHTVALHGEYEDRGLAVISVSLNEPSEETQVRDFLEGQGAHIENLLSKFGGGTEAIEAFNLPGPVPCYRVYDRAGKLHREFAVDPSAERQFTPDDIEAAVKELL
jgi:thiol-disulfide isomerase/thioredoxin